MISPRNDVADDRKVKRYRSGQRRVASVGERRHDKSARHEWRKLIEKARVTFRRNHDLHGNAARRCPIRLAFLSRVSVSLGHARLSLVRLARREFFGRDYCKINGINVKRALVGSDVISDLISALFLKTDEGRREVLLTERPYFAQT